MIVVAIIGILAAIALPAYQGYTQKAKFTEVTNATAAAKTALEVCYSTTNDLTDCSAGSNGVPANITAAAVGTGPGVVGVSVTTTATQATIVGTAYSDLNLDGNGTYTLTGTIQGDRLVWAKSCNATTLC
jgi:type IV pilus assembly protein PilA